MTGTGIPPEDRLVDIFQAAFCSRSPFAMSLRISRALAVRMPTNIHGISVALVRALNHSESIVLLVVAEAALKAAGPFHGYGRRQFFSPLLVFAGPSLPLEVRTYTDPGGELRFLLVA